MSMTPEQAADIKRAWRGAAEYWTKHAPTVRALFAPLTEKLMAAAEIAPGQEVLDIAGGAGEPSLVIADRIAPGGSVTCTDIAPEMIAGARQRAAEAGISNLNFEICPADALPFADNSFDAVVCRFGAMFFPAPLAAAREILRVLRPGGRVALAVWGEREANPFLSASRDVAARFVPPPPPVPDAPDAFRYAEAGKLAAVWRAASVGGVSEEVFDFQIVAPISRKQFWQFQCELSDTLRGKVAQLSTEQQTALARGVAQAVRPYFPGGKMCFPARVRLVTGRK
jgi:SAM-dependent methyltransferase